MISVLIFCNNDRYQHDFSRNESLDLNLPGSFEAITLAAETLALVFQTPSNSQIQFLSQVCKNGSFHLRGNVYVHYKSMDSAMLVYNSIDGRFFAGKQVKCEFVNVTRWKVAICRKCMKSRFKGSHKEI
ncbi:hypothetical protein EUGRSUZ_G00321 [Eucalyptus grandis]|uniref:Uncharacterized protein n=2 Tax=Eucalyptus grandis TaxID=71139 RepID=A0ACC3K0B9_EUCGR|nr:hypothetical protein EUGRSUZ_G00321 [Eucalyptus grandis]